MKTFFKIVLMIIIASLFSVILKPIITILSGIIGFGMGVGLAYLVVSWIEDKYEWFR